MGRLSSLLIGTITGASVAYFLTTEKGKELTGKVKGFVKEYQENPQEVHDSVKQSAIELSKQKTGNQVSPFQPKQEKESEEIVLELEEETALPEVEEDSKETAVEEE